MSDASRPPAPRRPPRTADEFADAIRHGDRMALSRAITLIESTRPDHRRLGHEILDRCMPATGRSVRIAVTGVPGVGKSTFIEALGLHVLAAGHRLGVLTVDPSSPQSRGSILGDKTRMARLASRDDVYIRPSPSAGTLGGVARRTRETMLLCEAAGYDILMVETVGVGQSETTVHSMVDVFLLLALTGAGDELQGIKRGIMELADLIVIHKVDGANVSLARRTRRQYEQVVSLFALPPSGWPPRVVEASSIEGTGLPEVWALVEEFVAHVTTSGYFQTRRERQTMAWFRQTVEHLLAERFFGEPSIQAALKTLEDDIRDGRRSPSAAAEALLSLFSLHTNPDGPA